jgi:hypothetical protein
MPFDHAQDPRGLIRNDASGSSRDAASGQTQAKQPAASVVRPMASLKTNINDDKTLCERCGAEMYRMHAVWRCSQCGYKTDCCGW